MNQILSNNILEDVSNKRKDKKKAFLKFQCISYTVIAVLASVYYFYSIHTNNKKEELSKKLLNNFNISTLYNTSTYSSIRTNAENMYISDGNNFNVIGLIEINSIKVNYPILSNYNDELLKIAPCRFYGGMPNEIGNLCIARP